MSFVNRQKLQLQNSLFASGEAAEAGAEDILRPTSIKFELRVDLNHQTDKDGFGVTQVSVIDNLTYQKTTRKFFDVREKHVLATWETALRPGDSTELEFTTIFPGASVNLVYLGVDKEKAIVSDAHYPARDLDQNVVKIFREVSETWTISVREKDSSDLDDWFIPSPKNE